MPRRDIIVIGSSAGGIDALPRLLVQLPSALAASVFLVQHRPDTPADALLSLLQRSSVLPVAVAEQGEPHRPGHVYLAPPGAHLIIGEGRMSLVASARENRARPSINRLFRSAAASYGSRTVGVILTGMLDDGAAGLAAVHDAGGLTIVQDPAEAAEAEMPRNALAAVPDSRVLALPSIGGALVAATREPAAEARIPEALRLEAIADRGVSRPEDLERFGTRTDLTCPQCHGPYWAMPGDPLRYRCYLGHAASAAQLIEEQNTEVERALWSAVRALQERGRSYESLARDARTHNNVLSAAEYELQARAAFTDADLARDFLLRLGR